MNPYPLLVALFFFITITGAKAQKGYVITKKNDTIYCDVKLNSTLDPQYQSPLDNKFHVIKAKYINGYRLSGSIIPAILKNVGTGRKHAFVNPIVVGKLSLYQETGSFRDDSGFLINYTWYYVSKTGEPLTQFANDQFITKYGKQFFHDMIADDFKLAAAFDNEKHLTQHGKFDIQTVVQYAHDYNKVQ